ncbi:hypothetical protein GWC95_15320 [Sediminibacterium roseum]|uniref:Uncharacterized protein n=1 Tax=Sediminibacterium roseum TaxID=1978412 RepID=A0ABX0A028_9BACT|nr:hypothetical protein [Sediminibacterium roseum]NCI51297.1 hypothetical protein [Sediminibacterium roseum]
MEVPDLISPEVWDKVRVAMANQEHWAAYNNTLLFVHEDDLKFFTNPSDAEDFAFDPDRENEKWKVVRINSLEDFQQKVESVMPGVVYKPVEEISVVAEEKLYTMGELLKNKTIVMNADNLEYLKNQLFFLGFGEGLAGQLEERMKQQLPEFSLNATHQFGSDKMEAVIHFRHNEKDGKQAYFCNHYIATLLREDKNRSQFIYINGKGQNVTFKEACNLLNSRSVFKELTPKDGEPYKAWLRIDHEKMDERTGYPKLRQFSANWGFDLKEAIGRMDFKGMKYDDQMKGLMKSLQKGNETKATLLKDGKEVPVVLSANPMLRTLNMYDLKGEPMFYPAQKVEQKYGQAPADAARQEAVLNDSGVKYEKKNLLDKNKPSNGLLDKKPRNSQSRSRKIS